MTKDANKRDTISNLYRYSDLTVEAIAQQVDMETDAVQDILDTLIKKDALEVFIEQSATRIEKVMTPLVISLDYSKTPREAAALMAEKEVGSVVVLTKDDCRPFGIVTHSDIVRWAGLWPNLLDDKLENMASRPLITITKSSALEEAAETMIKHRIHKLPVVDDETRDKLVGIVTITDLAVFLSPSRRPGLARSVLHAISRGSIREKHLDFL
jgi:CBS domain-containing protein